MIAIQDAANGMIPLSIHHWTSVVIPFLDELNVARQWTYLNKACITGKIF
jgi:hypothetical protein